MANKNKKLPLLLPGIGVLCLVFFMAVPNISKAQMFSVTDQTTPQQVPLTNLYVGYEPVNFEFDGDASLVPQRSKYNYNDPILRFRLEAPGVELYFGYGAKFTGSKDVNYLNVGGKYYRAFRVLGDRKMALFIPVQFRLDVTNVRNDQVVTDQFRQSSFSVGGGAGFRVRLGKSVRLNADIVPQYGYSVSAGATFGGSIYALTSQSRLYFDDLFGKFGLSLGYDYNFKRYDINVNRFDYKLHGNSLLLGITF